MYWAMIVERWTLKKLEINLFKYLCRSLGKWKTFLKNIPNRGSHFMVRWHQLSFLWLSIQTSSSVKTLRWCDWWRFQFAPLSCSSEARDILQSLYMRGRWTRRPSTSKLKTEWCWKLWLIITLHSHHKSQDIPSSSERFPSCLESASSKTLSAARESTESRDRNRLRWESQTLTLWRKRWARGPSAMSVSRPAVEKTSWESRSSWLSRAGGRLSCFLESFSEQWSWTINYATAQAYPAFSRCIFWKEIRSPRRNKTRLVSGSWRRKQIQWSSGRWIQPTVQIGIALSSAYKR